MRIRTLPVLALAVTGFAFTTPLQAQAPLEDVIVAVPNFTFTLTPTLVADELKLWEKHGLRFKMVQSRASAPPMRSFPAAPTSRRPAARH
jgi:ABC-type nitrate/sulfonate/bicarbonate transport system substrate-binding protein